MHRRIFHYLRTSKQGSALVFVIIALVVVSILTLSLSALFRSNLKQTKYQEQKMKAYYLALSGIDLAKSALNAEDEAGKKLINTFWSSNGNTKVLDEHGLSDTIIINNDNGEIYGTIEIRIDAFGIGENREVRIQSRGILGTLAEPIATNTLTLKLKNINAFPFMDEEWE